MVLFFDICYNEHGDNMNIKLIETFVKHKLRNEPTGHDYLHALRVLKNAKKLVEDDVDKEVIYACCLVHDLIDEKLAEQYKVSIDMLQTILKEANASESQQALIFEIINNMSFRSGKIPFSKEGKIVQDADRLDAIGAIGIARAFSYGGNKGRPLYCNTTQDGEDTVSHFYQKLLHLADKMNTTKAKKLASKRTLFLQTFLDQLENEIG